MGVNVKRPIYAVMEFLNSYRERTNSSSSLAIKLKKLYFSRISKLQQTLQCLPHLIFMTWGTLLIKQPSEKKEEMEERATNRVDKTDKKTYKHKR
jgi:hypothetical protein